MCGIAGWVSWDKNLEKEKNTLEYMTEKLSDRGPDAKGFYLSQHAAIGHRRLSVIDPANGAQPMIRKKGEEEFIVTYNGELYNMNELHQQLESLGYRFQTNCDTEVLLQAYIEWGPSCVERFNGIYAFGIWNSAEQTLFLARDRIGVKPLFYAIRGQNLLFASELKALLVNPLVEPQVDAGGLAEVLLLGPARTPGNGVFKGVAELKPGYHLFHSRWGTDIKQYWSLVSHQHTDDFDTTAATVRDLLQDTVTRQLMSDVPVCTLLSGGLDSSALTALTALSYQKNNLGSVSTYSVDYVDNDKYFKASSFQPNSDAPWVKIVTKHFGTTHHEILLDTPDLAGVLPQAAIARDLPGMADVDTSLYLFCREIKKGATVALSGECADEVFGGYPWFYRDDMTGANTFPWSLRPDERMAWLAPAVRNILKPLNYVSNCYHQALAEVPRLKGEDSYSARRREIFYLSLTRWMPTLLDRKDRMSMASGLEVRVPFCDHRIVEYVWNVPWEMKNHNNREKGLLRQALSGILPDDVLWRKKSPYPKTHNPEYLNRVRNWLLNIIDDPTSPLLSIIDVQYIRSLASQDIEASAAPWFGQLMGFAQLFAYLIQLDTWLREYKVQIV